MTCSTCTRTSISMNRRFKRRSARTDFSFTIDGLKRPLRSVAALLLRYFRANKAKKCGTAALFALDCVSMNATNGGGHTHNMMRVLGIDPAAAGPTGYGIVE